MISLKNVSLNFSGVKALNNFSMDVSSQGISGLIGPNGAGKSTVFNVITHLSAYQSGEIYFENQLLSHLSTEKITALGISRTFQNIRLLGNLTVLDNLYFASIYERRGSFVSSLFQTELYHQQKKHLLDRAHMLLDLFSLSRHMSRMPTTLAYGEQRKLEIARSLMRQPKLILLDEPAAGMNDTEKVQLANIIQKISSMGVKVLVIEHDMKFLMGICQDVFVLNQGNLIAHGKPLDVQKNDDVISIYLGKPISTMSS